MGETRLELHCLATRAVQTFDQLRGSPNPQTLYQLDPRVRARLPAAAAAAWDRWRAGVSLTDLPDVAARYEVAAGSEQQHDEAEATWRGGVWVERHSARYQRRE
jgi:hypothetical protein